MPRRRPQPTPSVVRPPPGLASPAFEAPGPSESRFTVPGDPVPQPRPRIYRNGGVGEDPRATRHKAATVAAARQARAPLLNVPVELTLVYHRGTYLRCDLDNLAKLTMDALSGVCWRDDSQIVCLQVLKFTGSDNPRTEVYVRPWPPIVAPVDWASAWGDP